MKKLVVFAGLILLCTLAQAQGGSDSGASAGITIVPRIDFNPKFYGGSDKEVTLGNSSLYSLFEGNITENLSFSVCNHWLSSEPKYLYQNTWHSDDVTWCDWANLTYSFGNFYVTAGKDVIPIGGFEFEQYDYDLHPDLCSSLWNNFVCYQWGGKIGFMNEDETQGLAFMLSSSPYSVRPFGEGLMSYSLQYSGSYGPLNLLYSTNMIGNGDGYDWVFSLGHQIEAGDFTFELDATNKVSDEYAVLRNGVSAFASAYYNPSDKWEFLVRGGIDRATSDISIMSGDAIFIDSEKYSNYSFGGAAHWFPLKGSKDLRLHAAAAYNTGLDMLSLTVGAIYYLSFPKK